MTQILSGRPVAAAINEALTRRVQALRQNGVTPGLALIRLGEQPDDLAYERSIVRACQRLGARAESLVLPIDCAQEEVIARIEEVNRRADVHGCLLFRPLPEGMDDFIVCEALDPRKDIDGMSSRALGALFAGREDAFAPCTAQACLEMLNHYGITVDGKHALVIGRSLVAGRPVSQQLLQANATVTLCHSHTEGLAALCRQADILIAAAGQAGLIGPEHIRPGQVILDVGTNSVGGTLCGDVRYEQAAPLAAAISPVPGGVGAVTTAVLLKHLVQAAERSL